LPVSVEEEYPYPPPDCAYNSLHAFPVVHILKQLKKIYKKKNGFIDMHNHNNMKY
jgi:hypothetical protein